VEYSDRSLRRALVSLLLGGIGAIATVFSLLGDAVVQPELHNIGVSYWPEALAFNGFTPREFRFLLLRGLGLALFCGLIAASLVTLGDARRGREHAEDEEQAAVPILRLTGWPRWSRRYGALAVSGLGAALVLLIAATVFRGTPIVDDEATYRMQAELLASGRVMDPPVPPEQQWHREPFTIFTRRGTTGKYLFGAPLLQVPGVWLGFPALSHVLLAALTLWLLMAQVRRAGLVASLERPEADAAERVPLLAGLLLALSPGFVFTTATLQSQAGALCCLALLVWARERGGLRFGLLGGAALGLCLATRPQVAVPCVAMLVLVSVRKDPKFWLGAVLGALPWVALIAGYNQLVTGDPWTLPGTFYSDERYGFGRMESVGGYEHTPLKGLLLTLSALWRLNSWGLGWPLSLLGPLAWLAMGRPHRRAVAPWAWIAVATFVFQFGYFFVGVVETGPVYHHAAVPFFAVSAASAVITGLERRKRTLLYFAALSMVLGPPTFLLEQGLRLRQVADEIARPMRGVHGAELVFLERSLVGGRPAGTVRGVPRRNRSDSARVIYFPRPTVDPNTGRIPAAEAIRARFPERACAYVYFHRERDRYVTESCERMAELGAEFDRREPPWF